MLNITHYQRKANQNHNEVSFHTSQKGCYPKAINAGDSVEKREPSYTVGMQTSTAIMKNSVEIPGNRTAL